MKSAPAIGFEYRASRALRVALALITFAVLVAVGSCGFSVGWKLGLMATVVVVAAHRLRQMHRKSVAAALWNADGSWMVHSDNHDDAPAVLASFRVLGQFVLLRLRSSRSVHVLLLGPDNSDADIRRRLRMRLATLQPEDLVLRW